MSAAAFTFNADLHEYRLGGHVVPSCTGALRSGGLVAAHFLNLDELDRKSEFGREAHRACHLHNLGKLGDVDFRLRGHVDSWVHFKQHVKRFQLISSEQQLVAYVNGMPFGMQLDVNAIVDGDDTVIELKTGEIYPHHGVQLAGYAAGLPHEKFSTPWARFVFRKRLVVQLRESGIPKIHKFTDRSDFEVFNSLLYVASWKRRHEKTYKESA